MITATSNYTAALSSFFSGKINVAVEIDGYSRIFTNTSGLGAGYYDWIVEGGVADYSYTINDTEGGADQATFSFNVLDFQGEITADFPGFVFEGKTVAVKTGLPGLAYSDWTVIFNGYIDTVDSDNNNTEYQFSCLDPTGYLASIVFQNGDDGSPTSDTNFHTLNGHPLDIMLEILQVQLLLPASFVNAAQIQAYRDGPYSGMQFLFKLAQPVAAADFIMNQLLKPIGAYIFVGNGQITIGSFLPIEVPTPAATFGPGNWTSIPSAEETGGSGSNNALINYIQWQFDKDDEAVLTTGNDSYNSSDVQIYSPSVARYGINNVGELTITADGMRSAFQGFFIAKVISYYIFLQYGFKTLIFDSKASECIWNSLLIETGDFLFVTHPQVPDRINGVMGITNKLFRVLNKTINFSEGRITFTMIDASYLQSFGFYLISPNGEAVYASASSGDKEKYMFMCNGSGEYSNGDPGHTLG